MPSQIAVSVEAETAGEGTPGQNEHVRTLPAESSCCCFSATIAEIDARAAGVQSRKRHVSAPSNRLTTTDARSSGSKLRRFTP